MRITNNMMTRNYLKSLNSNLSNLAKIQERIFTGRQYSKGSENVASSARAFKVREQLSDSEMYKANLDDAEARLSSGEGNLKSLNLIIQTARERILKGVSDDKADQREVFAQELSSAKDQVLQFMNAQYGDKYLFGGTNNAGPPFTIVGNDLKYNGISVKDIQKNPNTGELFYKDANGVDQIIPKNEDTYIDVGLGLSVNGSTVDPRTGFKTSFSGLDILGYGQNADGMPNNIFNVLDNIVKEFEKGDTMDTDSTRKMMDHLGKLNDKLMLNVTEIGSRTQFLEMTTERLDNDILNLTELQSKLEMSKDTDEAMNLQQYQYTWKVTLQFGSEVIPQSIFDFMK